MLMMSRDALGAGSDGVPYQGRGSSTYVVLT